MFSILPMRAKALSQLQSGIGDLLLVNGDPIADINLLADPKNNLLVIMKDGKIYKNKL